MSAQVPDSSQKPGNCGDFARAGQKDPRTAHQGGVE